MSEQLETAIAHLSHTVEELSGVVATQDAELRRLTHLVEMLVQREVSRETDSGGGVVIGDERPPHY